MSQHFQAVRLARAQRCRHMQTTGVCIDFLKLQNLQLLVLAATPVAAGHTRNPQLCDERTRNSLQVCLAWFRACDWRQLAKWWAGQYNLQNTSAIDSERSSLAIILHLNPKGMLFGAGNLAAGTMGIYVCTCMRLESLRFLRSVI